MIFLPLSWRKKLNFLVLVLYTEYLNLYIVFLFSMFMNIYILFLFSGITSRRHHTGRKKWHNQCLQEKRLFYTGCYRCCWFVYFIWMLNWVCGVKVTETSQFHMKKVIESSLIFKQKLPEPTYAGIMVLCTVIIFCLISMCRPLTY